MKLPPELLFQVVNFLNIQETYFLYRVSKYTKKIITRFMNTYLSENFTRMNLLLDIANSKELHSLKKHHILHLKMIFMYYYYIKGNFLYLKNKIHNWLLY